MKKLFGIAIALTLVIQSQSASSGVSLDEIQSIDDLIGPVLETEPVDPAFEVCLISNFAVTNDCIDVAVCPEGSILEGTKIALPLKGTLCRRKDGSSGNVVDANYTYSCKDTNGNDVKVTVSELNSSNPKNMDNASWKKLNKSVKTHCADDIEV